MDTRFLELSDKSLQREYVGSGQSSASLTDQSDLEESPVLTSMVASEQISDLSLNVGALPSFQKATSDPIDIIKESKSATGRSMPMDVGSFSSSSYASSYESDSDSSVGSPERPKVKFPGLTPLKVTNLTRHSTAKISTVFQRQPRGIDTIFDLDEDGLAALKLPASVRVQPTPRQITLIDEFRRKLEQALANVKDDLPSILKVQEALEEAQECINQLSEVPASSHLSPSSR